MKGRYAFVTNSSSGTLSVVDVSSSTNPVYLQSATVGNFPVGVVLEGRYAYVANSTDKTISIVDVSNPSSLSVVTTTQAIFNEPWNLAIDGRYLYVVNYNAGIGVVDVTSSTNPILIQNVTAGTNPNDIAISGSYAYVVNSGSNNLSVIKIPGLETTSLIAASAELGSLNVTTNGTISGSLNIGSSLSVGIGGIFSNGPLAVVGTSTMQTILPSSNNRYDLGSPSASWANVYASGTIFGGALTITGLTSLQSATWTNATGTNTTSTNLYATLINFTNATGTAIYATTGIFGTICLTSGTCITTWPVGGSTSSWYGPINWSNATGTNTTSTNLYAQRAYLDFITSTGTFLTVSSTSITMNGRVDAYGLNRWFQNPLTAVGITNGAATTTVDSGPNWIVFDGTSMWMTSYNGKSVSKVDVRTNTYATGVWLGEEGRGIGFDGSSVWAGSVNNSYIWRINPVTNVIVATTTAGSTPRGTFAFDGTYLWVSDYGTNTVAKVYAATGTTDAYVTVGSNPIGTVFDGTYVWSVNEGSNTVSKISVSTNAVVATVPVGSSPEGIAFDGSSIWVSNYTNNSVTKINAVTAAVTATTTVGIQPRGLVFDGKYMWVANYGSNTASKIDVSTNAVVQTYSAGSAPYGIAFDGFYVWVVNSGASTLTKIPAFGGSGIGTDYNLHANLMPDLNNQWNLGSASNSWANIYASGTGSFFNGLTWTSATGTNTTSTNLYAMNFLFNGATGSNINVTGLIATTGTINMVGFTNATGSNLYVSGLVQFGTIYPLGLVNNTYDLGSASASWRNIYASGTGSTFFGINWTYATGTNTTSTNLYATNLLFNGATGSNINVTGITAVSSTINNINFVNATGTNLSFLNATGTNLYSSITYADLIASTGTFLTVSSTSITMNGRADIYGLNRWFQNPITQVSLGSASGTYNRDAGGNVVVNGFASPQSVAFDGTYIWVANSGGGTSVSKVDVRTNTIVGTATVGANPYGVAFDGTYMWVSNYTSANVSKVDVRTNTTVATVPVGTTPYAIAFDGAYVWVANGGANNVTKIDVRTNAVVATTTVGVAPTGIAFDGAYMWVTNSGSGSTVSKIDVRTNSVVATTTVGSTPYAIAFDGAYMWVANKGANSVSKIDVRTNTVVATVAVESSPYGIAFDGSNVWTTNYGDNTVSKIDVRTNAVVATSTVGTQPYGIAFDGAFMWVANYGSNSLSKIPAGGGGTGANFNLHANLAPDLNNVWSLGSASNSWANIYASGTIAGANAIFTNATATTLTWTNATGTNFYVTNFTAGTFSTTNITWTNATGTNTTSTNLYGALLGFSGATGSNLNITNGITAATGTINSLNFWSATGTSLSFVNATGTSVYAATGIFGTICLTSGTCITTWPVGSTTSSWYGPIMWSSATGTNTTSTNLYASNLLFNGATGSNLYVSRGNFDLISSTGTFLTVSSTGITLTGRVDAFGLNRWFQSPLISTAFGGVVTDIATPSGYGDALFDGTYIWKANSDDPSNSISKIDPRTNTVLKTIPLTMPGYSAIPAAYDGRRVWVINQYGTTINAVDTILDRVVATATIGATSFDAVFDGTYLWVSNTAGDGSVSKVSVTSSQVLTSVSMSPPGEPHEIAFDGTNLWVAEEYDHTIAKIDVATESLVSTTADLGYVISGITYDGRYLWVADSSNNRVRKLDPSNMSEVASIAVGTGPYGLEFDGRHVWVANTGADTVSEIDVQTNAVVGTYSAIVDGHLAFDGTYVWVPGWGHLTKILAFDSSSGKDLFYHVNLLPDTNNAYDLGSASNSWANVYASGTGSFFNGINWTNATGTNTTSTNFYVSNLLFAGATGSSISLTGGITATTGTINNLAFVNATGSNLYVSGLVQFGTIYPLGLVNNTYDLGSASASWRNIYASGTGSTFFGINWTYATGTSATTTNFFATSLLFTNATGTAIYASTIRATTFCLTGSTCITSWPVGGDVTGMTWGAAEFPPANNTYNLGSATGSLKNIYASGTLTTLYGINWTYATGTSATTTNFYATNLGAANFTPTGITWTNATGTNTTSTSLYVSGTASTTRLLFANATGTNLFATSLQFTNGTGTKFSLSNLSVSGSISNLLVATTSLTYVGALTGLGGTSQRVFVVGRYVYLAQGSSNALKIIDAQDIANPKLVGTVALADVPNSLAVSGRYAYVTLDNESLVIVDVSNPKAPVVASTLSLGSSSIWPGIVVQGHYVYVSCFSDVAIRTVDVSDPLHPRIVATTSGGNVNVSGMAVSGRYIYAGTWSNFTVTDVSDPTHPIQVGDSGSVGSQMSSVAVRGRYAYADDTGNNTLNIFDVSNPAAPVEVATMPVGANTTYGQGVLVLAGQYLYMSNSTDQTYSIYDVSSSTHPIMVATSTVTNGAYAQGIFVNGRYLYSTESDGLTIYWIPGMETTSLLANSAEVGTLEVGANAIVGNSLDIGGALTVGMGGIISNGSIAVTATTTPSIFMGGVSSTTMTWTSATGTNLYATYLLFNGATGSNINLSGGIAAASGTYTSINYFNATGTDFFSSTLRTSSFSANSTGATTTNLNVSGIAWLSSSTYVNGQKVCLADGTNCPGASSGAGASFFAYDNAGLINIAQATTSAALPMFASSTDIRLDTNYMLPLNSAISHTEGTSTITIATAGTYRVTYFISTYNPLAAVAASTTQRLVEDQTALKSGFTEIPGSRSTIVASALRYSGGSASVTVIRTFAAGSLLKLQAVRQDATVMMTVPSSTGITIESAEQNSNLVVNDANNNGYLYVGTSTQPRASQTSAFSNFAAVIATSTAAGKASGIDYGGGLFVYTSSTNATSTFIYNNAVNQNAVLEVRGGCTTGTTDLAVFGTTGDTRVATVRCSGQITSDYGVTTNPADYAEWFPSKDAAMLHPGDLVAIDPDSATSVKRGDAQSRDGTVGVISNQGAFIGNSVLENNPNAVLVGMLGQLKVNADATNDAIAIGDPLMMGGNGTAVKASGPGMIVGKAMEALAQGSSGMIMTYVTPQWWGGDLFVSTQNGAVSSTDQSIGWTSATGTNTTSTNLYASAFNAANATSTNLFATSLGFSGAVGSRATVTSLMFASATGTVLNTGTLTASTSTVASLTFANATGGRLTVNGTITASTTNVNALAFANATGGNLSISGTISASTTIVNALTFANATGSTLVASTVTAVSSTFDVLAFGSASGSSLTVAAVSSTAIWFGSAIGTGTFELNSAATTTHGIFYANSENCPSSDSLIAEFDQNGSSAFSVTCAGRLKTTGALETSGAGYGEYLAVSGTMPIIGDVLAIDGSTSSTVHRGDADLRNTTIGIASDDAAVIGNIPLAGASSTLVGMAGSFHVRVDALSGPIIAGDTLMMGNGGTAVRAKGPGMVIGTALESFITGTGTIIANVNPIWWAGDLLATGDDGNVLISDLTVASTTIASATTTLVSSPLFTFQGSAYDEASSTVITSSFAFQNVVVSPTSSEFTLWGAPVGATHGSPLLTVSQDGDLSIAGSLTLAPTPLPTPHFLLPGTISFIDATGTAGGRIFTNAAGWGAEGTSYAVMYPSDETLEPGDVVVQDVDHAGHVKKATTSTEDSLIGVVSDKPAFLAGIDGSEQTYPVAFAGRVATKVSVSNGAIHVGDYLTSSDKPGIAIKATDVGQVVGIADEDFDGSGTSTTIAATVSIRWFAGATSSQTVVQTGSGFLRQGFARIAAGDKHVDVAFPTIGAYPMVVATPSNNPGNWWITGESDTGFSIVLLDAQTADVVFTWFVQATPEGLIMTNSDSSSTAVNSMTRDPIPVKTGS